jgi:hypothetical protein
MPAERRIDEPPERLMATAWVTLPEKSKDPARCIDRGGAFIAARAISPSTPAGTYSVALPNALIAWVSCGMPSSPSSTACF